MWLGYVQVALELVHFIIVFGLIIVMFALAGQFLYGADLAEFHTISSSAQACFALMLGGGDFGRMYTVTGTGTNIFYWSWVLLGLLIIMNLVIAILSVGHERASKVIYGENEVGFHPDEQTLPQRILEAVSPRKPTPRPGSGGGSATRGSAGSPSEGDSNSEGEEDHKRKGLEEELAEIKHLLRELHKHELHKQQR